MQQGRVARSLVWSIAAAGGLLLAPPALSVLSAGGGAAFHDPERLVDTLMRDDERDLMRAREAVERAEAQLQEAIDAGLPQAEIDERAARLELAEAELAETELRLDEELALVRLQVAELSPSQLFALNRSLQNARSNGLLPDLDSDELGRLLDESYDKRQIDALTRAFEEEAKFRLKAAEAERLFDETGDPALLERYERFTAKAETQKQKFLSKIERFASREAGRAEMRSGGRDATATRGAARDAARLAARQAATLAAEEASGAAVREAARTEARRTARGLARAAVAAGGRKAAKRGGRGKSGR